MSTSGSVTDWNRQLKAGERGVAQQLWERYFTQLMKLARDRLRGSPRRVADEEDVALQAFECFCTGVEKGRFPQLADREDLWKLLAVITDRKPIDLIRHGRD